MTFIPKPDGKDYINHIDGSRLNNDVTNLEWCDHKENNNHAFDTGLINTGKKVILLDKKTGEPFLFRSLTKASEFLGHSHAYLSSHIHSGKAEIDDYEIFLKAN